MGIFTKKKQEDNHIDKWITMALTPNDDGISRDQYYPHASGGYAEYDLTKIPIYYAGTGSYNPYKYPVMSDEVGNVEPRMELSDDLIDKMWEKMYSRPVIVRCSHCNSHNTISNPTCIQCGAPMGDYKRMKKYER